MVGWGTVWDPDAADAVSEAHQFTLQGTSAGSGGTFKVGEFDGKVTLNAGASLDFESEPSLVQYSIAMFAKDSGGAGLSDMKTQIIFVRDVNDVTVTDLLDGTESAAATPPGLSFKTDQTTSPDTITVQGTNFMASWTSGNGTCVSIRIFFTYKTCTTQFSNA